MLIEGTACFLFGIPVLTGLATQMIMDIPGVIVANTKMFMRNAVLPSRLLSLRVGLVHAIAFAIPPISVILLGKVFGTTNPVFAMALPSLVTSIELFGDLLKTSVFTVDEWPKFVPPWDDVNTVARAIDVCTSMYFANGKYFLQIITWESHVRTHASAEHFINVYLVTCNLTLYVVRFIATATASD